MSLRMVHVAVGVIVDNQGRILIAKRPEQSHQGGLWEFPGGKLEQGESSFDALKRELLEELAIQVISTQPLIKIRHDYGDKIVLLDVQKVTEFTGEAKGNEGQPILWVSPQALYEFTFPAANKPIVTAINLPQRMLITGEATSTTEFIVRLKAALQKGIKLVQLRVKPGVLNEKFVQDVAQLCTDYEAKVQLNTTTAIFAQLAISSVNVGLHLNSASLMAQSFRPVPGSVMLSASCHNEEEIAQACKLGADFICLSPVLETSSHPGCRPLGWPEFAKLVEQAPLPVFALGGMAEDSLLVAQAYGAQGVAGISAWW